jgi:hypothetical protein
MPSGFTYRPVDEFPALRLSAEARKRVEAKMESVRLARLRAMASASTYVVG